MAHRTVGIVTINDDTNYGNRLQNFALQEAVRSLGWEPETLTNRPPAWDRALLAPRIMHDIRHDFRRPRWQGRARIGPACNGSAPRRPPSWSIGGRPSASSPGRTSTRHRIGSRRCPRTYWADRYDSAIVGIGSGVESDVSTRTGHRLPGFRRRTASDRLCARASASSRCRVPSLPVPRVAAGHPPPVRARVRRPPARRRPLRPRRAGRAGSHVARRPRRLGSAHREQRPITACALRRSLLPRAARRPRRTHG